jgi:hypothetical protein
MRRGQQASTPGRHCTRSWPPQPATPRHARPGPAGPPTKELPQPPADLLLQGRHPALVLLQRGLPLGRAELANVQRLYQRQRRKQRLAAGGCAATLPQQPGQLLARLAQAEHL